MPNSPRIIGTLVKLVRPQWILLYMSCLSESLPQMVSPKAAAVKDPGQSGELISSFKAYLRLDAFMLDTRNSGTDLQGSYICHVKAHGLVIF